MSPCVRFVFYEAGDAAPGTRHRWFRKQTLHRHQRSIENSTTNHAFTPAHREVTASDELGSAELPKPVQLQSSNNTAAPAELQARDLAP